MQNTISVWINALVTLVNSWVNPTNLEADLTDAILLLNTVHGIIPNLPIVNAALAVATKEENALTDLNSSGYGIVGSAQNNGKTYSFIVVENGTPVAANFGI